MRSPDRYTDEEWLELMIDGLERQVDGVPGGPSLELQARWVGRSGAAAMRDCFPFYQLTKRLFDGDLSRERVLDFGVGWGRILRLFAHDVPAPLLFGVDVDPMILDTCAATGVPGTLSLIGPGGDLPFADGEFGLAYAYSVFTHLPESVALKSFSELARILRPGGQLTFTILGERSVSLHDFGAGATSRFAAGEHLYEASGGGGDVRTPDVYGWAAIPETWLRLNLTGFSVEEVMDDEAVSEQVVVTARRLP